MEYQPLFLAIRSDGTSSRRSRDFAEHRAAGEAGTARIIEIEDATHQLAGGIQPRDWFAAHIQNTRRSINLQPAEGERDATGNVVGFKGRSIERVGPVRFVDRKALGAAPILDVRIERDLCLNGGVVAATSALAACTLTPSSLSNSSSSVSALTFVTCFIRYSSRSRWSTLPSNSCQANCPGCSRIIRPYLAYV